MLNPFERSADFYDDLYEGKNYAAEADYVDALIRRYKPGTLSLLDLGCGTGRHAIEFAKKGYTVLGVDRNLGMLSRAQKRRATLLPPLRERLAFQQMDIGQLRLEQNFDAIVALFHVISYQTSTDAVMAAFRVAKAHLRDDGVLVFDCWYGPGVLADPPVTRLKRSRSGSHRVLRFAEPVVYINENIVDVTLQFVTGDDESGAYSEFSEAHKMRYFFIPELRFLLNQAGLHPLIFSEWMTDREPSKATWNLSVVACNIA